MPQKRASRFPSGPNRRARAASWLAAGGLLTAGLLAAGQARAAEPRLPGEPRLLQDSAVDLLDVADAFDDGDLFDLNLRLAFEHASRSAPIRRETAIGQPGLSTGGLSSDRLDVATYQESTQRLVPSMNIGLLPDLALTVRMPVILAHSRKLEDRNGSAANASIAAMGLLGEQLFDVPFESPTRSGIEYLAIGLDWGVMSQARTPQLPNWVIGLEGRFNVSDAMRACNKNPARGEVECAYSADINRNGVNDPLPSEYGQNQLEGDFRGSRSAGVSRGTTAFEAHAYVSKRYKYIEPYSGVSALIEFPVAGSEYGAMDLQGALANHPPLRGTVILGTAVVPWEQPEKFQRISIDFRVRGTYVSEGRDYSELFDALGSSNAASLRAPNFAEYQPNLTSNGQPDPFVPSVVNPESRRVSFSGLTDVQQHGDYDFRAQFTWQAGEYVRFDLGAALRVIEAHFITFDQSCNPNFVGDPTISGPCKFAVGETDSSDPPAGRPLWQAAGIPNPNYRAVINEPGRRFKVDTSFGFGTWVRASVLF